MKNNSNIKRISAKKRLFNNLSLPVIVSVAILTLIPLPAYCSPNVSIKQTAIKFLFAMGGVLLSSLMIYLGLTVYNKLFHYGTKRQKEQNLSFETPKNIEDAIDFFIKKNKI